MEGGQEEKGRGLLFILGSWKTWKTWKTWLVLSWALLMRHSLGGICLLDTGEVLETAKMLGNSLARHEKRARVPDQGAKHDLHCC